MTAKASPQLAPTSTPPGPAIQGSVPASDLIRQINERGNQYMQEWMAAQESTEASGPGIDAGSSASLGSSPSIADSDNTDGDQVLVADTGGDMDAWVAMTGQEQASDGSLGSMVDSAVENAGDDPIDSVEFKSHGHANWQQVGSGPGGTLKSPLTEEQKADFARLGAAMAPDGVILLAGCQVAANFEDGPQGISLMIEVAQAANRAVCAGVAIQLPIDGIEGTRVTAYPDGHYVVDTSVGKQIYDVSADGLMKLKNDIVGADSVGEAIEDAAGTVGEMASGYYETVENWALS